MRADAQHDRRLSLRPLRDDRQRLAENALQKEIQFIRREPRRIRRVRRHDNLGTAIYDYIGMRRGYSRKERKERKENMTGRPHHNPSNVSEPSGERWMQKRVE